jgi:hypothetical protein
MSLGGALLLAFAVSCDFSPTGSFDGFDGMGSRVSGSFVSEGETASGLRAAPQTTYDGMTVHVRQDASIETAVNSNGTFTLEGIPDGKQPAITLRDRCSFTRPRSFRGMVTGK